MAVPREQIFLTANYYGDSGGTQVYYYWVQPQYAWGWGNLSNGVQVTVLSLSHNNVVALNWSPAFTAMNYIVYRNTTGTPPAAGAQTVIATNLATADGLVDNGLPTFTFTMVAPGPTMADVSPQQAEAEAKKASDEAKKKNDELIKELEETQKKADEQQAKDAEQAAKLNKIYNEKYQLGVRETEAQKKAASGPQPQQHQEKQHEEQHAKK